MLHSMTFDEIQILEKMSFWCIIIWTHQPLFVQTSITSQPSNWNPDRLKTSERSRDINLERAKRVTQSNVSVTSSNDVIPTNNHVSNDRVKTTNRRASSSGTGENGVLARNDYNDYDYAKKNGKDSKGGKKKKKKGGGAAADDNSDPHIAELEDYGTPLLPDDPAYGERVDNYGQLTRNEINIIGMMLIWFHVQHGFHVLFTECLSRISL
ncbi:uncharacterized protein LOC142343915 isoform X2 [Convolutriloba macropyga]|uniref:uncharacterized protein LOC142343915 isoform X2 n=1 Tax=Convolutriloba macropyga TaxID=536237 RepID=UPI003F52625E